MSDDASPFDAHDESRIVNVMTVLSYVFGALMYFALKRKASAIHRHRVRGLHDRNWCQWLSEGLLQVLLSIAMYVFSATQNQCRPGDRLWPFLFDVFPGIFSYLLVVGVHMVHVINEGSVVALYILASMALAVMYSIHVPENCYVDPSPVFVAAIFATLLSVIGVRSLWIRARNDERFNPRSRRAVFRTLLGQCGSVPQVWFFRNVVGAITAWNYYAATEVSSLPIAFYNFLVVTFSLWAPIFVAFEHLTAGTYKPLLEDNDVERQKRSVEISPRTQGILEAISTLNGRGRALEAELAWYFLIALNTHADGGALMKAVQGLLSAAMRLGIAVTPYDPTLDVEKNATRAMTEVEFLISEWENGNYAFPRRDNGAKVGGGGGSPHQDGKKEPTGEGKGKPAGPDPPPEDDGAGVGGGGGSPHQDENTPDGPDPPPPPSSDQPGDDDAGVGGGEGSPRQDDKNKPAEKGEEEGGAPDPPPSSLPRDKTPDDGGTSPDEEEMEEVPL